MNLAGTSLLALLQISLSMVFQLMLAHALFLVYKLATLVCEAYPVTVLMPESALTLPTPVVAASSEQWSSLSGRSEGASRRLTIALIWAKLYPAALASAQV